GPAEATLEEKKERIARPPESAQPRADAREEAPPQVRYTWSVKWLAGLLGLFLLLFLGALSGLAFLAHDSPAAAPTASAPASQGAPPVPTPSQDSTSAQRSSLLMAWLCAVTSLGCPAAQVRPEPANCPAQATEAMFNELKIRTASLLRALVDVSEMGEPGGLGLYREGPLVGRLTVGEGLLVEGTLLYGYLWTGPGLMDEFGRETVIGRYTRAVLPDGREYPVCIVLGSPDGRMFRLPGPKAGTVQLRRDAPVSAVRRWP
ncbi:MAG TPA: serine/threonine protein kinase, partial [Archangium sp.]|nr:serine/threonine protein kinase [Archangium sp.]